MYKTLILSILIIFSIKISAQDSKVCKQISTDVIRMFQSNECDSIYAHFDENMQKAMNSDQLEQIWPAFESNDGKFIRWENQREKTFQGYKLIETNLIFKDKAYTLRLAFDKETKISGLFFVPIRTNIENNVQPETSNIWREENINIKNGFVVLPGTLCTPKNSNSYPIVVFVHGSGPNDRDETIGPNKIFSDLAHALAKKGIGSIRYDKRTYLVQSHGDSLPISGLNEVVIDDALAAIDLALRTVPQDNKVFLLGHSLGASLAPRIANKFPNLGGVIMLAATSMPLEDEVLRQTKYLLKRDGFKCNERKEYKNMKVKVKNVKEIETYLAEKTVPELPLTNDTAFWRDVHRMTPIADALKLQMPVFILQGERDYQVTMDSYEKWKTEIDGRKNFEFKSYPLLNHLFHEGNGKSYPDEYSIKGNIPAYVLSDISLWILSKN